MKTEMQWLKEMKDHAEMMVRYYTDELENADYLSQVKDGLKRGQRRTYDIMADRFSQRIMELEAGQWVDQTTS